MAPISGDKSFIVFWFCFSVEGEGEDLSMLLSLPMQVVPSQRVSCHSFGTFQSYWDDNLHSLPGLCTDTIPADSTLITTTADHDFL